jgi:hypothetical protein
MVRMVSVTKTENRGKFGFMQDWCLKVHKKPKEREKERV